MRRGYRGGLFRMLFDADWSVLSINCTNENLGSEPPCPSLLALISQAGTPLLPVLITLSRNMYAQSVLWTYYTILISCSLGVTRNRKNLPAAIWPLDCLSVGVLLPVHTDST